MKAALRHYLESLAWVLATIARISGRQPGAFVLATVLMGILRIMQFLVMVLPLKVVLLASHEGVPAYTPFIDPQDKSGWIIGLAGGTILAYILAQALDGFARRICEKAGTRLMAEAAVLNIVPNQREQARNIFSDLASILADALFWAAGMVLYAVIAPPTFLTYMGMMVASLALGTLFAIGKTKKLLGKAHGLITENTHTYLSTNSTIIFFVCFLVILYPYVAGIPLNMLIGLISIVLLRRTLSAAFDSVRGIIKVVGKRPLVDTLMFKNRQFVQRQKGDQQKLSEMFAPAKRMTLVASMLERGAQGKVPETVLWTDPTTPGIACFTVIATDKSCYQLQVYTPKNAHLPINETALFGMVERKALHAPQVIDETKYGNFTCRLVEAGAGAPISVRRWKAGLPDAIVRLAGVMPSKALIEMYRITHLFAHEKLSEELLKRVRVAVRNDADTMAIRELTKNLDAIKARVAAMPVFISSRDFVAASAMANGKRPPLMMFWGRWSLEPLGSGAMAKLAREETETVLARLREVRTDIDPALTVGDLELAASVQQLVGKIERGHYAAAIEIILDIEELRDGRETKQIGAPRRRLPMLDEPEPEPAE